MIYALPSSGTPVEGTSHGAIGHGMGAFSLTTRHSQNSGACEVMVTLSGILGKMEAPTEVMQGGRSRQVTARRRRKALLHRHQSARLLPSFVLLSAFRTSCRRGRLKLAC